MHKIKFASLLFLFSSCLSSTSLAQIYMKEPDGSVTTTSYKKYDDIRIFKEGRTYWLISNGNIKVETSYDSVGLQNMEIQRFVNKKKIVLYYQMKNKSLTLTGVSITPIRVMTCTDCVSESAINNQNLCLEFKSGSDVLSIAASELDEKNLEDKSKKVVNSSCDEDLVYENIPAAFRRTFKFSSPGNRTPITSCMMKENVKSFLLDSGITEDQQTSIVAKYELTAAKIHSGSEAVKGIISCADSLPNGENANITEDGKITITNDTLAKTENLTKAMTHETLHSAGLKDDKIVEEVVKNCLENVPLAKPAKQGETKSSISKSDVHGNTTSQTVKHVQQISSDPALLTQAIANGVPAEVATRSPSSVSSTTSGTKSSTPAGDAAPNAGAKDDSRPQGYQYAQANNEVTIPSSYELAAAGSYNNYDSAGAVRAYNSSVQQSSSLLEFATRVSTAVIKINTTMKNPSLAATTSLPAVAATSSFSTRTPASAEQASDVGAATGTKAAKASAGGSKDVNLDAIAAAASKGPDVAEGIFIPSAPAKAAETSGTAAKTASSAGSLGSGSSGSTVRTQNSGTEVASSGSSLDLTQTDKATAFFTSPGNYSSVKLRLNDSSIQSQLEAAEISITNTKNQTFGANPNTAKVIIFDNGSAFVVRKKK